MFYNPVKCVCGGERESAVLPIYIYINICLSFLFCDSLGLDTTS